MSIEDQLISDIKPFINIGNLEGMQELWGRWRNETDFGREIAWDLVFYKVYLHAALKKQKKICMWLDSLYLEFNPITQIALRQMFPYARYLLERGTTS